MEHRFLQLHLLTSYPPANLNRDDLGRPKTAMMGNALRLRISSQSLKRAWRTSEVFERTLAGAKGIRTKTMGDEVAKRLIELGTAEKNARSWAADIAKVFGKPRSRSEKEALHIEQLAHFSPREKAAIDTLTERLAHEQRAPTDDELKLLGTGHGAPDIALFGRMLASSPGHNVEAAAQVAHAIGVHKSAVEDDFFTAVDDLNTGQEDLGAGHMGEIEFGAALFYLYICIDKQQLAHNLDNDKPLIADTLRALLECAATVAPTGKQNSFASRAYASFILAECGDRQPRSLSVAFLKPVTPGREGLLQCAIDALLLTAKNMDAVYGPCAAKTASLNALTGEGSLAELMDFSSGC